VVVTVKAADEPPALPTFVLAVVVPFPPIAPLDVLYKVE